MGVNDDLFLDRLQAKVQAKYGDEEQKEFPETEEPQMFDNVLSGIVFRKWRADMEQASEFHVQFTLNGIAYESTHKVSDPEIMAAGNMMLFFHALADTIGEKAGKLIAAEAFRMFQNTREKP